jgi:hypothetical protein
MADAAWSPDDSSFRSLFPRLQGNTLPAKVSFHWISGCFAHAGSRPRATIILTAWPVGEYIAASVAISSAFGGYPW